MEQIDKGSTVQIMKRFGWFALGCVAVGGLVWGINTSIAQLPERDGPGQQGPQSGPRREGPDDRRPGRPPQEGGRGGEGFSGDPERRGPGGPGPGPGPGGPGPRGPHGPEGGPPPGPHGGPMGGGPMGGPGPGMFGPPQTRFLKVLDLNRDFQISGDEIAKASESLKRLDIDQDGIITEEEFTMPPPRPPRHGMEGGPHGDGPHGDGPRGGEGPRDGGPRGNRPEGDGPEGRRPPPPRDDAGPDEPRRGPPRGEPGRDGRRGGPEGRPQPEGPPPGASIEQPTTVDQAKDTVAVAPSELPKELTK